MGDATRKELEAIRQAHGGTFAVDHLLAVIEDQDAMLKRWKYAVEGLTPNGSEYVDDPEACATAIRERTRYPKQIIELRAKVEKQEREIEQLKTCDVCERPATDRNCRSHYSRRV
jgi:hypothetical protein